MKSVMVDGGSVSVNGIRDSNVRITLTVSGNVVEGHKPAE
jgi:hypothetical protein